MAVHADPLVQVENIRALGGFTEIVKRAVGAAIGAHCNGQINYGSKFLPSTVRDVLNEPQEISAIINEVKVRMRNRA